MKRRREFWAKEREDFERQIIIKDYPKTNYLSIFVSLRLLTKMALTMLKSYLRN
ncbi:MAG: hypothetical protein IPI12_15905 [Ignavibacteriales bacterium]|nr:hypothetical protein [Ignavibacteriales bacterium]